MTFIGAVTLQWPLTSIMPLPCCTLCWCAVLVCCAVVLCCAAVPCRADMQAGVLIRGNLRTDRLKVFNSVCDKVQELFGDKYKVLMIEDPEAYMDGPAAGSPASSSSREGGSGGKGAAAAQQEPRVAFQVGSGGLVLLPAHAGVWIVAVMDLW